MKPLVLLRPEPGLGASAATVRALGLTVIECPLFVVEPLAWQAPPAEQFDALLLTSANAVRHAGDGLAGYRALPVLAVGDATAEAARAAGLVVERVGDGGVTDLLAAEPTERRLLHLAGQHVAEPKRAMTVVAVYASIEIADAVLPSLGNTVIAVHSPRAGKRLAELVHDRSGATVAAISIAAAAACGSGWAAIETAAAPDDSSLLALAARLCQGSDPE